MFVPRGYTYYDKKIRIDRNPIRTAMNVCKQLISKRVSIGYSSYYLDVECGTDEQNNFLKKVREWASDTLTRRYIILL